MLFKPVILAALLASSASALYTRHDKGEKDKHDKGKKPHLVPGKVFDRFITIWLENTNFADAAADPNFSLLTKQGIHLTNYFAVTHPSEPNYVASVGGEYFGMDNDDLNRVPQNVSSIVDLLEDKGISWAEYQEHLPTTGYQGFSQPNAAGANDYVRKHNPLVIFDSVANVPNRVNLIKNFTLLDQDIANDAVPQWAFITPNMTNDGHDTDIAFSSKFSVDFLTPLLKNPRFNGPKTLILLTFDESGDSHQNRVDSVLLGNAVPKELVGTSDSNFYNHYSEIATVEANWGLHTLGRYDVGANVFEFVAKKTGDRIRQLTTTTLAETFLDTSYPGVFNDDTAKGPLPIPNTRLVVNGRTVLDSIIKTWGSPVQQACTTYTDSVEIPSGTNPPALPAFCKH